MCTNGVNESQLKLMIEQMDDQIALNRRWTHKMFHSAGEAGYSSTAAALKEVQSLLDDARALLSDARDAVDEGSASASGVTVNLV